MEVEQQYFCWGQTTEVLVLLCLVASVCTLKESENPYVKMVIVSLSHFMVKNPCFTLSWALSSPA